MTERIKQLAAAHQDELQRIRHHLHAHPELSYQEYETAQFVCNELDRIGISYQSGVAGTGVVACIEGSHPEKKCIALRADMDALPIQERNETAYISQNEGIMHACGHDVHTTCLLGAAYILNEIKNDFEGTVKLIFQPGEEKNPGGASLMIKEGVLENPRPAGIIGLHVFPELPAGYVGFREGQYMASADEIYITVKGKSGHAALPHLTVDPIAIACQIVMSLQQVVSRKANATTPTVLSFGKISGGSATNIIPDEVVLWGTLRTFDETWRATAHHLIRDIAQNIAIANGGEVIVDIPPGYPFLYNDESLTKQAQTLATTFAGKDHIAALDLRMTAEDFSFYTQQIPGCFFRLGTNRNNEQYLSPVHTATFDIDEDALKMGAGMMAWLGAGLLQ